MNELGRIGVLAGGPSSERGISIMSGQAVYSALKGLGLEAVFIDIKNIDDARNEIKKAGIDVAFIALHGKFGEDGTIQTILEELGLPYTGSGPLASRIAIDKIASREIFSKNGLNIPKGKTLNEKTFDRSKIDLIHEEMGFPLVVKPQLEGSSIGISIPKEKGGLEEAIDLAFRYGGNIIIEQYIRGKELTVGILDEEPLPVIQIVAEEKFYDYNAKYRSDHTKYILPAPISKENYEMAQETGRFAHRLLGCRFFSRIDLILSEEKNEIFVLEVNTIPGFTDHSLLPKAAAYAGISFGQLCLKITELAFSRKMMAEEKV